jgi:hypothetical protein
MTDAPLTGKDRGSIFDAMTPAMLDRALLFNRRHSRPEPGFWLVRRSKGGAWVPAAIILFHTTSEPGQPDNVMERSPFLAAFIEGKPAALDEVWLRRGREIEEWEYRHAVDDQDWLRRHRPGDARANSYRPVDWRQGVIDF